MEKIRPKQVVRYMVMPGVLPRLKSLFGTGFFTIAILVANIFQTTRLLPPTHPYLNKSNFGKFGVHHVFAEAGRNLVFDRKHIDQILVFFALISGFVILVLQFILLGLALISKPALAGAGLPFVGMFTTPDPTYDIALGLLDSVFGVPDMFGSQYAPAGNPMPFHQALHALLSFYSMALLLVGVVIFLYYVFVVIAETAQSGTPFGRRFSNAWVPLRLVMALGLLVPINWGLNSAQYIVLTAAKMGSGFATNGWYQFNEGLTNALGVADSSLFVRTKVPDGWPISKFMLLAAACKQSYEALGIDDPDGGTPTIEAYLIKYPYHNNDAVDTIYADAVEFYNGGDVIVRFGVHDEQLYRNEPGAVFPFCGEIAINTSARTDTGFNVGPWNVQAGYHTAIISMWSSSFSQDFGRFMASRVLASGPPCTTDAMGAFPNVCNTTEGITSEQVAFVRSNYQSTFEGSVVYARNQMVANADQLALPQDIAERGWAGAGIWYNRIAEINGGFINAVSYLPIPSLDPAPMQFIVEAKRAHDQNLSLENMYEPRLSSGEAIRMPGVGGLSSEKHMEVAKVLWESYKLLGNDDLYAPTEAAKKNNPFLDMVDKFLGINGLFNMRENADIHPLAQLVGLGKGIVDGAVRSLFTATIFSVGGGYLGMLDNQAMKAVAGAAGATVAIFKFVATLGLSVGFILYYVVPFMPFLYFFFAVGTWIKTIFEAMVGAPLWALAHLRIDGDGLSGESAKAGYFMILEIFLRPILNVFGLVASLIIFAAMVKVLNGIFTLVVANLSGFDNNPCEVTTQGGACTRPAGTLSIDYPNAGANAVLAQMMEFKRSTIDEFFFTILYAVIVYLIGMSCFKMIDQVPAGIMRWLSSGTGVFADDSGQDLDKFKGYIAVQGASMTSNLGEAMTKSGGQFGQGLAQLMKNKQSGSAVTPGSGTP